MGPAPFEPLLEVRKGKRQLPGSEVRSWFESYLAGITKMSEAVDEM